MVVRGWFPFLVIDIYLFLFITLTKCKIQIKINWMHWEYKLLIPNYVSLKWWKNRIKWEKKIIQTSAKTSKWNAGKVKMCFSVLLFSLLAFNWLFHFIAYLFSMFTMRLLHRFFKNFRICNYITSLISIQLSPCLSQSTNCNEFYTIWIAKA